MRAEINERLLREIQAIAKLQGRDESEVLEDAVRYFLTSYYYFAELPERHGAGSYPELPEQYRAGSTDLLELLKRIDRGQQVLIVER